MVKLKEKIHIRKFNEKDFPQILEIERECFRSDAYTKDYFNYLSKQGDFLVVEEGGEILGYILYSWKGEIFSIAVKPRYWNRGVGSLLLTKALGNLKDRTSKAWLQTRESNLIAQKFFEKFRFKRIRKLRKYYQNEDGILMIKEF